MSDPRLDANFAELPPAIRAEIEGLSGAGLHHAPEVAEEPGATEAFHHPERDDAGTEWEPDWEPIETCPEGEVVMLDDGERQVLGRREMGLWMQLADGNELAQPDFRPMLWLRAPEQVKYDMM